MNKIFLVIILVSLSGCAELEKYKITNLSNKDQYFQKPESDILIYIDTIDSRVQTMMNCSVQTSTLSINNNANNSFKALTPFVNRIPLSSYISSLKKQHDLLSKNEKDQIDLVIDSSLPIYSIVCQSDSPSGIKGKIYFSGREVSSSSANLEYGIVSMNYQLTKENLGF